MDPELPLQVICGANQRSLGAVLLQQNGRGERRCLNLASTVLDGVHETRPAIEKELLGVAFALHSFHRWLTGRSFILHVNNRSLAAILEGRGRLPRSRSWAMWLDLISEYAFEVQYHELS